MSLSTLLTPFDRALTSYYLLIGVTGLLLALGLVMVWSSSYASQLDGGMSPWAVLAKQLIGVLVGLPMMWVLSKVRPSLLRSVALPLLLAAIVGLVLVQAIGKTEFGSQRWITVAGVPLQPSEFAKLAFLIWGADLLARKEKLGQLNDWRGLLVPLLPGAALLVLLIGDDLGTTFVLLVIFLALLWVIGTPGRLFVGVLGLIGFVLLIMIIAVSYRSSRLFAWFDGQSQASSSGWQLLQGKDAIGSGGIFGVGLGNSHGKWGWVPNDSSDFIFAILGEELGLVGTGLVVLLYGGLAYAGLRIARRVPDPFMRLAAAGATAWIVAQALVNICAVIGLVPITGVPLPLISNGLSSLLVTMAALGMLMSFARYEPGAMQALAEPGPAHRLLTRIGLHGLLGRHRAEGRGLTGGRSSAQAPSGRTWAARAPAPAGRVPAGRAPAGRAAAGRAAPAGRAGRPPGGSEAR
jgi:cell division protein FtsW